ncbi:MAG: efflux RND transporter permease subunit, partial [Cyanobacteria bacterium P01_E01_bin.43]
MTSYQAAPNPYELDSEAWWVQQWVDLLNSYRFKKRLERGRRYAREGNILRLDFTDSKVYASVQGTADEPYKLSISIDRERASTLGIDIDGLAPVIQAMLDGRSIGTVFVKDRAVDIKLISTGNPINDPTDLENIFVRTGDGKTV